MGPGGWDPTGSAGMEWGLAAGRRWDLVLSAGYSHLSITSGNYTETAARLGLVYRLP